MERFDIPVEGGYRKEMQYLQKLTTCEQQKKYDFIKKLLSQSVQTFRSIEINQYDINFAQPFEQLQSIDDAVTPLIYAAFHGLKQILKILLKNKNADIDLETPNNKQTPLTTACICGNYQIVRILLLYGAQVNKPNNMNMNPLSVILFRLVQQQPSFQNKIMCIKIADLLILHGADINWIIDKVKGYSLLHYFCAVKGKLAPCNKKINYQIIKFLIQHGANIEQRTLTDQKPMDLLQKHCNKQQILMLFQNRKQKKIIKAS